MGFLPACVGYFIFYVGFGVTIKYFLGSSQSGLPGLSNMEFIVYSTLGGFIPTIAFLLWRKWHLLKSSGTLTWRPAREMKIPVDMIFLIPCGISCAVIILTTTLMYMLPASIMVGMVILRGGAIVASRLVDELQIRQGISRKRVRFEENLAVWVALIAVGIQLLSKQSGFPFNWKDPTSSSWQPIVIPLLIVGFNILAYGARLYLMGIYKARYPQSLRPNLKAFFAIEQMTAFATRLTVLSLGLVSAHFSSNPGSLALAAQSALLYPHEQWPGAAATGILSTFVAFFSFHVLMAPGKTATFIGLINRITSLLAGTIATLCFWWFFQGSPPTRLDWGSFGLMILAVLLLTQAERMRSRETT